MTLWIAFTIAAAAMQTLRFVLQKRLQGGGLSSAGATFARFLFAAPLACGAALLLVLVTGTGIPLPPFGFWAYVLLGGVAQIIATDLTVRLFQMRNFAVGVAFTKTETVQVALFSLIVLAEAITPLALLSILIGLAGIILLSRPPEPGAALFGPTAANGLAAGALFALAAVGYRGATLALEPAPFFLRALMALAAATTLQTIVMSLWLAVREPGAITRVLSSWRATAPVGLTGMLGSLGWFAAFSLQNAAYVRALGQVEIIFTLLAGTFIFGERMGRREGVGVGLVIASVLMLVLALG
jgi:drug/metabolite transporter (DMT)-like permease